MTILKDMTQNEKACVSLQEIKEDNDGQRLDNFLFCQLKGVPKSHIYRIIRRGEVRINKKRVKASTKLKQGDSLRLPPINLQPVPPKSLSSCQKKLIQACIVEENNDFLVINKPSGLASHGGSGVSMGVIERLRAVEGQEGFELVHRLDKPTSGCLLIAKKKAVLRQLHALIREKKFKKTYLALLHGRWQGPRQKIVNEALLRHALSTSTGEVVVSDDGKASTTMFRLLENFESTCLVEAYPMTGRTHQIRVHAASFNQPIVGDTKYGLRALDNGLALTPKRLFLHAQKVHFVMEQSYHIEVNVDLAWQGFIDGQRK